MRLRELNAELAPFRILTGIECDINVDGSLDQTDELLGRLDVVVASVHSDLRADGLGLVDGDTWAPLLDGTWTRTARTPEQGWSESASAGLRYAVTSGALSKNTIGNKDLQPAVQTETEFGINASFLDRFDLEYEHMAGVETEIDGDQLCETLEIARVRDE